MNATAAGTDHGLFEPLVDQIAVDVVAWRARVLRLHGQICVPEAVAKVFVQIEQLSRLVPINRDDLVLPDVVHYKQTRAVIVRFHRFQRYDVFTGVSNENVVIVQQLHLPHPQIPVLVKPPIKLAQRQPILSTLNHLLGLPEQKYQHPMLQTVYRRFPERPQIRIDPRPTTHRPQTVQEPLIRTAKPPNHPLQNERPLGNRVDVNVLVLNRQNRQRLIKQVQALIVRQHYFVHLKVLRVGNAPVVQVDNVQRVILQRAARRRFDRLVVRVQLVKVGPVLLRDEQRRTDDHEATVVREQAALPVQLLFVVVHVDDVLELELGKKRLVKLQFQRFFF